MRLLFITVVLSICGLSGSLHAFAPPKPTPYFTAFSPIFGYDPVYGTLLGLTVFSYPTGEVNEATRERSLNVVTRFGPHASLYWSESADRQWGDWGYDYSIGASNFFSYQVDSEQNITETPQWNLAINTGISKEITPYWKARFAINNSLSDESYFSYPTVRLSLDHRDETANSKKGYLMQWDGQAQPAWSHSDALSGFKLSQDLRWFHSIKPGHIIALRNLSQVADGQRFQAELGGANLMRAYVDAQFSAERMTAVQAEYRFPIWDFIRGNVFIEEALTFDEPQPTAYFSTGVGLRFHLPPDNSMSVRWDLGFNEDGQMQTFVNFNQVF